MLYIILKSTSWTVYVRIQHFTKIWPRFLKPPKSSKTRQWILMNSKQLRLTSLQWGGCYLCKFKSVKKPAVWRNKNEMILEIGTMEIFFFLIALFGKDKQLSREKVSRKFKNIQNIWALFVHKWTRFNAALCAMNNITLPFMSTEFYVLLTEQ